MYVVKLSTKHCRQMLEFCAERLKETRISRGLESSFMVRNLR